MLMKPSFEEKKEKSKKEFQRVNEHYLYQELIRQSKNVKCTIQIQQYFNQNMGTTKLVFISKYNEDISSLSRYLVSYICLTELPSSQNCLCIECNLQIKLAFCYC